MANKSTTGQKHPYHLVDPSPLPFLSSVAGLAMAAGLVFYIDPTINEDPTMKDVEEITLSYTFFKYIE